MTNYEMLQEAQRCSDIAKSEPGNAPALECVIDALDLLIAVLQKIAVQS